MNSQNQTLLIGALMGSLVGAAAVLLSTPYSGAKLRSKILNGLPHDEPKARHTTAPARRKKMRPKAPAHKAAAHKGSAQKASHKESTHKEHAHKAVSHKPAENKQH